MATSNPLFPNKPGYNLYKGARYVPKFTDKPDGQWDSTIAYEPLTIVLYQGNSYTSRWFVPVGVDINNTQYWLPTGNFNAQLSAVQMELETISKTISDLSPLSSFTGNTPGEKLQNAINTSSGVILDDDVLLENGLTITKNNFVLFGNGKTITINGDIKSETDFMQNYFFIGVRFTGQNSFMCSYKFLGIRFIACIFQNFISDIFKGELQTISFNNCYFQNNSGWVVNANRMDNVTFNSCNIENGSQNFCKCTGQAYGCSFTDCVIESLIGTAFNFTLCGECFFKNIYMENCGEYFKFVKDYCGNISLNGIHANYQQGYNGPLATLNSSGIGGMYGLLKLENSYVSSGSLVKINSTTEATLKISCKNNRGQEKDIEWDTPLAGVISSDDLKTKYIELSGTWGQGHSIPLKVNYPELFGHRIIGCIVVTAFKNDSITVDNNCGIAYVLSDQNLILNGDGTNEITYRINILYS